MRSKAGGCVFRAFAGALALLTGCGIAVGPTPHSVYGHVMKLVPRTLVGQPVSALQVGSASWLTLRTATGVTVQALSSSPIVSYAIPLRSVQCSGAGTLRRVGSFAVVTGCTDVWILRPKGWVQVALPAALTTPQVLTGTGAHWWFLAIGTGASGNEAVTLWTTLNAGASWSRVATSGNGLTLAPPGAPPYFGDKTGLSIDTNNQLWLTGATMALGGLWLYRGGKSGTTWAAERPSVPYGWGLAQLVSYPPRFVGSTGYLPIAVDSKRLAGIALYTRTNARRQWKYATSVSTPAVVTGKWHWTVTMAHSVWLTAADKLWVSRSGPLYWRPLLTLPPHWIFTSVSFAGADGVLVAVRSSNSSSTRVFAVWHTHDGGRTWSSMR